MQNNKTNIIRRIISLTLALLMVLDCISLTAFADLLPSNPIPGKVTYNVSFKDKDGVTLVDQVVEKDQAAIWPDVPDVEGYSFAGWSSSVADMTPEKITGDVTFTATYKEMDKCRIVIHYVLDDEAATSAYPDYVAEVYKGEKVDLSVPSPSIAKDPTTGAELFVPKNDEDKVVTFKIDAISDPLTEKTVVYLAPTGNTYKVKILKQKLDAATYETVDTITITGKKAGSYSDAAADLGYLTYEGFTMQPVVNKIISHDGTTEVVVRYDRNLYTLFFDSQGGTDVNTQILPYGEPLSSHLTAIPTKTAYTFEKWVRSSDSADAAGLTMPKWKPGKNMGKPVRCYYQVPVSFKLQ